ncbi:MAG: C39 family peptidase, partial [Candidatus Hydrogenedentes bacterium]|nr:C39 family peptidase [Candidatus Hydrogenedentota bacterium]
MAPKELLSPEYNCGVVSAWMVLEYFGKRRPAGEIIESCRNSSEGTHTICIANAFLEWGFAVEFYTDADDNISTAEAQAYQECGRYERFSIGTSLSIEEVGLKVAHDSAVILLFNNDDDEGHFSPVETVSKEIIYLANYENLPIKEFMLRWSAPEVLRQCLEVKIA